MAQIAPGKTLPILRAIAAEDAPPGHDWGVALRRLTANTES
jgi:hypothetical protein